MGRPSAFFAVLLLGLLAGPAGACTTFCLGDGTSGLLFGKNYDYDFDDGLLIVNKRGVAKASLGEGQPVSWVSRFGGVTFNQYGRELPCGGMNEKGLVVELMWLEESQYPAPDARGALPTLQWIQYQLDNQATVAEVLASDATVRIEEGTSAKIHFLVADAGGDVAAIEYLGGTRVAYRGDDLPFRALTNDTYEASLAFVRDLGPAAATSSAGSLDRFARAARRSAAFPPTGGEAPRTLDSAFALLDDVAQGDRTCWSIVYELKDRRVHFRTRQNRRLRTLDLAGLDFRCETPVRVIDVNAPVSGDLGERLVDYTLERNRDLVRGSFAKTEFLQGIPAEMIERLSGAPGAMPCVR
jgi:choloylglycine hydrolase